VYSVHLKKNNFLTNTNIKETKCRSCSIHYTAADLGAQFFKFNFRICSPLPGKNPADARDYYTVYNFHIITYTHGQCLKTYYYFVITYVKFNSLALNNT